MRLKLQPPVRGSISQYFGQNATTLYASEGLGGHPGTDYVSFYDDVITDGVFQAIKHYTYNTINKDNPDLMKYRGVCQIIEADDGVFELIYGHCDKITCAVGPSNFGDPLATEGNTGDVFVGNHEITEAEKLQGSHLGAHVHYQLRRLRKVKSATLHSITMDGIHDFVDPEGFHFDVPNFDNSYNGCIDALQFMGEQNNYKFFRQLDYGSIGVDVFQLQKRLIRLGFGSFLPTGFLGSKTQQAIKLYQEANGLDQVGRIGSLTLASLNA